MAGKEVIMQERVQKIIAAAGITSRRAAEELILEGRVRVNGKVVTEMGVKADPDHDHIKVDGKLINPQQPLTYVMLNKPAGYVTTMADPEGRPTVSDLLKGIRTRVYPVGRLDYHTEGLLLLTNDGDFAYRVTHPRHELPKTYLAKIKGVLEARDVENLEKGVFLQDGRTAPARVKVLRKEESNSWVEITIHEGRKRQVRRMIDHTGHTVIKLKRTRVGNLGLGDLTAGTYRHLASDEVKALQEMAQGVDAARAGDAAKASRRPAAAGHTPDFIEGPKPRKRVEIESVPGPPQRDRKPAKARMTADAGPQKKEASGRGGFPVTGERPRGGSTRRPVQFRRRPEQRPGGRGPGQGDRRVEKSPSPGRGPSSRTTGPGMGEGFRKRQSGRRPFDEGARRPPQREPRSEGRGAWQGEKGTGRTFEGSRRPFMKKGPRPAGGPTSGGGRTDERRSAYERPRTGFRERTGAKGSFSGKGPGDTFGARRARPEGQRTVQDSRRSGGPGGGRTGEKSSGFERPRTGFRERTGTKGGFSREDRGSTFGARKARPEGQRTWQDSERSSRPGSRAAGSRSQERAPFSGSGSRSGGRQAAGPQAGKGRAAHDRPPKGRGNKRK